MSEKVKKAQTVGGQTVIGGNLWSAQEILRTNRLPPGEIVKFIYLVNSPYFSADIAVARDDVPLHIHKFHDEFQYILEGTTRIMVGDRTLTISPGSIVYIPEGTVHGGKLDEEVKMISVYTPRFDIKNPDRIFVNEKGNPLA